MPPPSNDVRQPITAIALPMFAYYTAVFVRVLRCVQPASSVMGELPLKQEIASTKNYFHCFLSVHKNLVSTDNFTALDTTSSAFSQPRVFKRPSSTNKLHIIIPSIILTTSRTPRRECHLPLLPLLMDWMLGSSRICSDRRGCLSRVERLN